MWCKARSRQNPHVKLKSDFLKFAFGKAVLQGKDWVAGSRSLLGECREVQLHFYLPFIERHGH